MLETRANELVKKYSVRPGIKCWKVKSWSRDNQFHFVWNDKNGWGCSCEYKQIHKNETCDHQRYVQHLKLKFHGRNKKKKRV